MYKNIVSPGPFRTFYLVFAYIVAFALWWAYLLYEKNETAYKEKVELNTIAYKTTSPVVDYTTTDDYLKVHTKYLRQKTMIIGEGSVFILLLLVGLMRVRKVFYTEMALADQQRNFLLSITHELKSPLSTVKLSLQTLAKRKLEPEKTEKLIGNSLQDLDRLETLVDNILFAAKIERDEHGFSNEDVNLSDVVAEATERFATNKKGIEVLLEEMPDIYMHIDVTGFISVVNNLIENAIKYSEPGTKVNVQLTEDADSVNLKVSDNGVGIAAGDKLKIFEKFYRVGNENTRRAKGTGLGLYIVRRFVEIYKGKITVDDNEPTGTIFTIVLPKAI